MTIDRGTPHEEFPITNGLVDREARIAHFVRELSYLDGDPYAFGRRTGFTLKLEDALKERNEYLWNQPNIRAMIESFPELNNFGNAGLEAKLR